MRKLQFKRRINMIKIIRALSIKKDLIVASKKVRSILVPTGGDVCKSVGGSGC